MEELDKGRAPGVRRALINLNHLTEALEDFNALRWSAAADADWLERLDRLAQATFRAAEHLISPGDPIRP